MSLTSSPSPLLPPSLPLPLIHVSRSMVVGLTNIFNNTRLGTKYQGHHYDGQKVGVMLQCELTSRACCLIILRPHHCQILLTSYDMVRHSRGSEAPEGCPISSQR